MAFPIGSLARGLIGEVLALNLRTEYQLSSTNISRLTGIGNWTEIEEVLEKVEMWQDAKESFRQMCENGEMKNGLWGQMVQLDFPKTQKSLKEI